MDVKTAAGIAGAGVTTINAIWVAGARLSIAQTFEASAAGLGLRAPFALGDNDGSRPHGGTFGRTVQVAWLPMPGTVRRSASSAESLRALR